VVIEKLAGKTIGKVAGQDDLKRRVRESPTTTGTPGHIPKKNGIRCD
jgi:hypothetical protein